MYGNHENDLKKELNSLIESENYIEAYFFNKKIPSFLKTNDHEFKKINELILKNLPLDVLSNIKVFEKSLAEASEEFNQKNFKNAMQKYELAMNLAIKLNKRNRARNGF